jgi:hypothetical protein
VQAGAMYDMPSVYEGEAKDGFKTCMYNMHQVTTVELTAAAGGGGGSSVPTGSAAEALRDRQVALISTLEGYLAKVEGEIKKLGGSATSSGGGKMVSASHFLHICPRGRVCCQSQPTVMIVECSCMGLVVTTHQHLTRKSGFTVLHLIGGKEPPHTSWFARLKLLRRSTLAVHTQICARCVPRIPPGILICKRFR